MLCIFQLLQFITSLSKDVLTCNIVLDFSQFFHSSMEYSDLYFRFSFCVWVHAYWNYQTIWNPVFVYVNSKEDWLLFKGSQSTIEIEILPLVLKLSIN
jgi:hypothetical protein